MTTEALQLPHLQSAALASQTQPAIETCALTKTYPGGVQALRQVSFCVRRGAIFALLGPNGAGKSTIVKILTTLSRPDSGEARIAGFDVVEHAHLVRNRIGCVAQRSAVDLDSTGRENLTLQGQMYGLRGASLKRRVVGLLEQFGISESADRIAREYSGGMQRKLDVALGLVHHPEILFLDEPTTGLDPKARTDLWDELSRLSQNGMTVLLTTHYLEEAERLAERVAIIDRGQIVVEGAPEALKAELRGDSIQIELASDFPQSRIEEALLPIRGLRDPRILKHGLHVLADDGPSAVPIVLLALESAGIRVSSVKVSRPSLDEVYLRYTGRTFEDAESEGHQ